MRVPLPGSGILRVALVAGLVCILAALFVAPRPALAQLTLASQFDPTASSDNCGLGFDSTAGEVWVYGCSAANVDRYSSAGVLLSSVPRAGEVANDVDVELSTNPFTLGATALPSNALLFINGESGPAEIYALDETTGAVLSTLNAAFGTSHVVGGAYHRGRRTLFLVQDLVPAAADRNRIAEIDTATGAVLNTFQIGATFSVNFGDLEVCNATGNLILGSSAENRLAEYTPAGVLVGYHALPVGVSSVAGLAIDDSTGQIWAASSAGGGDVFRLAGGPCAPTTVPALSGPARLGLTLLLAAGGWVVLGSGRGRRSGAPAA